MIFKPGDSASRVLGELEGAGRYEAVVSSGERYGIVTIRDMLEVNQPEQMKLGDYSTGIWRVLEPVATGYYMVEVAHLLDELNVRAFPVVEDNEVKGIISQVDISNALCDVKELSDIPAKELMKRPVVTIDAGEKVTSARRLMLDNGFSHIPITKSGRLVGILTAWDLVHAFVVPISKATHGDWGGEKVARFPGLVGKVMDAHPFTVEADSSALDVARGLRRLEKSACIMLDKRGLVLGIMTPRELVSILFKLRMEEELPVYIIGLTDRENFYERAVAEGKVRRVVERTLKFHPDITEVSVRIKRQQHTGSRVRYQLTARALSAVEHYMATAEGWDLMEVFDKLCENLDRKLRRGKPQPEGSPRIRRRGRR
jgi:CBS domain-containing protein